MRTEAKKPDARDTNLGDILNAAMRAIKPYTPEVELEVRLIAGSYLRRRRKLASSHASGRRAATSSRTYHMLDAPGAKLVAVLLGHPKRAPQVSLPVLKTRAEQMDMRRPSGEPVRVHLRLKNDGSGYRPISVFGPISRACQRLAIDVLRPIWGFSPFEFACRGRGRDRAVERLLDGINNRGMRWIADTDLSACFPSFNHDGVMKTVPLPRSVTMSHILIHPDTAISTHHTDVSQFAVRAGLPQGAISSPYVVSKLLEPRLRSVGPKLSSCYVDNISAGGRDQAEADTLLDTLASSMATYPAGPHLLKYRRSFPVGNESDILGYHIRRDARRWGGKAQAIPSRRSRCAAERRLLYRLLLDNGNREAITEAWANKWPTEFRLWPGRRWAADNAYVLAVENVWRLATLACKTIVGSGIKFSSFAELYRALRRIVMLHQPEPNWSDVERSILAGKPDIRDRSRVMTEAVILAAING